MYVCMCMYMYMYMETCMYGWADQLTLGLLDDAKSGITIMQFIIVIIIVVIYVYNQNTIMIQHFMKSS